MQERQMIKESGRQAMERTAISSSLEDYLEVIAEIIEANGHAHTKDIADRMHVKMPSVTNALQSLAARGMIRYQSHSPVILTAAGAETAAVIRRRHSTLKRFFQDILKLEDSEANEAACKIEHVIGEKVMSRFASLAEAIVEREDCAPLRSYLAVQMPQICAESDDDLVSLAELGEGDRAVVVRVAANLRGLKKFADLGLVQGTLLQMEGRAPFGDLMRVRVMGSSLSLRSRDAAYIWVKPTRQQEQ